MSEKEIVETKYYTMKITEDIDGDYEVNFSCAGKDLLTLMITLEKLFGRKP